ncbi:MAG TPA: polyprenol phosphomannose-dependent alpha 1,6 mannosyltransferase MptB [Jatrophihabitantaceae bacterium]
MVLPRPIRVRRAAVLAGVGGQTTAAYAAAGFAASTLIVLAGGHVGTARFTTPLTDWFGLLSRSGYRPGGSPAPGLLLVAGIAVLVLLWLRLARRPRPAVSTEGRVWAIGGAWALPFVVGPPLLSSDVYTYAAQGMLVDRGLDPYSVGPSALGGVPAVAAVDPSWRSATSPYGPLATWFQHFAVVLGGGPLGAVIVFRLVAVAAVVAIGLLAADLAGTHRIAALTLTVLNPLVLLYVVSAAHMEGLLGALLLGALVAVRRGSPTLGIVLACAAGAVKAPALIAVVAIIAWQRRRPGHQAWPDTARDWAVAVAACAGLTILVPHGWGWVRALNTPALGYTPAAPSSLIGDLCKAIVPWAPFDDLAVAGRTVALIAAGCIVAYLIATSRRRSLEATVGLGLLAVALLGPVIYPWYALWGVLCLAPIARGRMRELVVLGCAIESVVALPGLPRLPADLVAVGLAAGIGLLVASSGEWRTLLVPAGRPHRPARVP